MKLNFEDYIIPASSIVCVLNNLCLYIIMM